MEVDRWCLVLWRNDELRTVLFIGVFLSIGDFIVVFLEDMTHNSGDDSGELESEIHVDVLVCITEQELFDWASGEAGISVAGLVFWWVIRWDLSGWGVRKTLVVLMNWSSEGTNVKEADDGVVGSTVGVVENLTFGEDVGDRAWVAIVTVVDEVVSLLIWADLRTVCRCLAKYCAYVVNWKVVEPQFARPCTSTNRFFSDGSIYIIELPISLISLNSTVLAYFYKKNSSGKRVQIIMFKDDGHI